MQKAVIFLALMGLFLTSCKSDSNDPTPAAQTKTQLIAKSWQMQSATGTVTANPAVVVPVYQKGGGANNLIDFSRYQLGLTSDGKFTLNDGRQTQTGTWQLVNNDTQLVLTYTDNTQVTYTVNTASATNLDLDYQISPTTQNVTEKGYLTTAQGFGFDTSKGLKISTKLVPQ